MSINSFFMSLVRDISKIKETLYVIPSPKLDIEVPSPKTKEKLRKNKSETDFIKLQIPWIL